MSSGFDSFSLALFTTLAPGGIIGFIGVAIPILFFKLEAQERTKLTRFLALPYAVVLVGFIASATHLGTPSNALHVFSGIGRSPLSNEVLWAVLFLLLAGSHWMLSFKEDFPQTLSRIWLAASCVAGIGLIIMTSLAYSVATVITWNSILTPINLWLSALLAGPILSILIGRYAGSLTPRYYRILLTISILALIIGSITLFVHLESLTSISNNEFSAIELLPHYPMMIFAHIVSGILGIALTAYALKSKLSRHTSLILLVAACVFLFVAVFIPRVAFYELHMTAGF